MIILSFDIKKTINGFLDAKNLIKFFSYKMETQKELKFNISEIITRSPRLETIMMVEQFIKKHSGDFRKTELFNKLPKKMMWGTFNVILEYLYENNKIGIDRLGNIVYIWNPELAKRFTNKKRY